MVKKPKLIVVAVFLLAMPLYFLPTRVYDVWHDESYSAMMIDYSYTEILERTDLDVHPPLYYVLLKAWSTIAGDEMWQLRLMSSFAMLAGVALGLLLVKRIYGSNRALYALPAILASL